MIAATQRVCALLTMCDKQGVMRQGVSSLHRDKRAHS